MSGHKKFRDLARPIYEDPVRRARMERKKLVDDELLAAAAAGLSRRLDRTEGP